ncbi:hypothetical protein ACFSKW_03960 [Nonomuraea mangrovi]|uniref:Tyr recombinase domain-containing protein n=1 Tax=Nonomuraea mangrovi TaxID=2316207 RepID=A0ABW4SQH9_9ACTN
MPKIGDSRAGSVKGGARAIASDSPLGFAGVDAGGHVRLHVLRWSPPGCGRGLRKKDCHLPATGWGLLTLEKTKPQSNERFTDSGETYDDRGLKHRNMKEAREVPIPPELVTILRDHIDKHGIGADGRLFRTRTGGLISGSAYAKVWKEARTYAFTPDQVASPLAARPYDLRHAAVSLWLNAGVHAPEAAERAGHGVDVMLKVYAKCIDGQRDVANQRILDALAV